MCRNTWIFFALIVLPIHVSQVASQCGDTGNHRGQDKLALYRIELDTYWTRIRFPKHFPDQRKPAQFGRIVGRTHDRTFTLYRLGTRLSAGVVSYIETGQIQGLASEGNNHNVLDTFAGSSIPRGNGTSSTRAFLDGNHTLVSLVSRISPSPDWFIGVDSFQLCVDGNWVDSVTVELDPLDAGTNEGIKFMAPIQRTWPQNLAYRITSSYPTHPAGSFYYPNLPRLPPIATLSFTKLREYTLTDVYHEEEEMEFVSIEKTLPSYFPHEKTKYQVYAPKKPAEEPYKKYRYWTNNVTQANARAAIIDGIVSSYAFPARKSSKKVKGSTFLEQKEAIRHSQGKTLQLPQYFNRSAWSNNLFGPNGQDNHKSGVKNPRLTLKGHLHKVRAPRDCKLSDWSAWSACSRSCGVGETQRIRKIITKARRGGKPCYGLKETKWCGSAAPCPDIPKQIDAFFVN